MVIALHLYLDQLLFTVEILAKLGKEMEIFDIPDVGKSQPR